MSLPRSWCGKQSAHDTRDGFTLVELLAVIAILAILIVLLCRRSTRRAEAARRTLCVNNLRQLQLATLNFHEAKRFLPGTDPTEEFVPKIVALVEVLPFLEEQHLHARFDRAAPPIGGVNAPLMFVPTPFAWCPSSIDVQRSVSPEEYQEVFDGSIAETDKISQACYFPSAGARHLDGAMNAMNLRKIRLRDVRDGQSHTLFWSERTPDVCPRGSAFGQPWCDVMHFIAFTGPNRVPSFGTEMDEAECFGAYLDTSSQHPDGANYALGDGAVLYLRDDIDSWHPTGVEFEDAWYLPVPAQAPGVYQQLATRDGGEVVDVMSLE